MFFPYPWISCWMLAWNWKTFKQFEKKKFAYIVAWLQHLRWQISSMIWKKCLICSHFHSFGLHIFPIISCAAAHQCDLIKGRIGQTAMSFVATGLRGTVFINPERFAITYRNCIYYIYNSVVFPFNTEWKKLQEREAGWLCPGVIFMEIIPIKCQTHFTFNDNV